MTIEGARLRGTVTAWKRSYGFAIAMIGETPTDIFVHTRNFATHSDRANIKEHGLEVGDNIVFNIKRPRRAGKSNYEAANVTILAQDTATYKDGQNQAHEYVTDPQAIPASSGSAREANNTDIQTTAALHRRISDLQNSWSRNTAAGLDDDLSANGTLFMGYIYVFRLNKYITLEPRTEVLLSCRVGQACCRIIQLINELGETEYTLEPGQHTQCRMVTKANTPVRRGMPFAIRTEGAIVAEGSILEVLRHGVQVQDDYT